MPDPRSGARAFILAGSIVVSPVDPLKVETLRRAAIYETFRGDALPLDLDALRFRYRVTPERVMPMRELDRPLCNHLHARHRR